MGYKTHRSVSDPAKPDRVERPEFAGAFFALVTMAGLYLTPSNHRSFVMRFHDVGV